MASNRALKVDTPEQSKAMLMGVLDNQPGPARDIVALNAGVALYAANVAPTMLAGLQLAQQAIESGAAKAKLLWHLVQLRPPERPDACQPVERSRHLDCTRHFRSFPGGGVGHAPCVRQGAQGSTARFAC
jgi:hypothetical protein